MHKYFFPFWALPGKHFGSHNQSTAGSSPQKSFFACFWQKKFLYTVDGLRETKYNSTGPKRKCYPKNFPGKKSIDLGTWGTRCAFSVTLRGAKTFPKPLKFVRVVYYRTFPWFLLVLEKFKKLKKS